jgi:hypothetical protein
VRNVRNRHALLAFSHRYRIRMVIRGLVSDRGLARLRYSIVYRLSSSIHGSISIVCRLHCRVPCDVSCRRRFYLLRTLHSYTHMYTHRSESNAVSYVCYFQLRFSSEDLRSHICRRGHRRLESTRARERRAAPEIEWYSLTHTPARAGEPMMCR